MRRTLFIVVLLGLVAIANVGVAHAEGKARVNVQPWYDGCITKWYGQGEGAFAEHGNDVSCFSYGTRITALLAGTVSYQGWTSFGYYEVTWRLDNPAAAGGSPYAYAEDMAYGTGLSIGQHINAGDTVGYSEQWVEFGLTPDWAYGISNWRWGVNSIFLIDEARNGTINTTGSNTTSYSMSAANFNTKLDAAEQQWNRTGMRQGTGIELQWALRIASGISVPLPTTQEYPKIYNGYTWILQRFGNYFYIHDPIQNRGSFYDSNSNIAFPT